MDLGALPTYFCDTPVYGWNATREKWFDLGILGAVSDYTGGMTANAMDNGERKLITTSPLPDGCTVIRMGLDGKAYLIGSSIRNNYAVRFVYESLGMLEVWRPTKTTTSSRVTSAVTWNKQSDVWGNAMYMGPKIAVSGSEGRVVVNNTPFTNFQVVVPSDADINTEDELRDSNYAYVIQDIFTVNDVQMAVCSRRKQ